MMYFYGENMYKEDSDKLIVEYKNYVKEVRNGSTIIELVQDIIGQIPLLIEHYKTISTFVEQTIIVVNWLLGKEDKPDNITKRG